MHARDMAAIQKIVLLVEDEDPIAEMLSGFFERAGSRFLHAVSGEEALKRLRPRPVAIVLLDLNLPGRDGSDGCRELRTCSRVPVSMVTARDGEGDKGVGRERGADDYVTK